MKYIVGIAVDGRVYVEVEADNFDKAYNKANDMVCEINFGQLECVGWDVVNAEDENGNMEIY